MRRSLRKYWRNGWIRGDVRPDTAVTRWLSVAMARKSVRQQLAKPREVNRAHAGVEAIGIATAEAQRAERARPAQRNQRPGLDIGGVFAEERAQYRRLGRLATDRLAGSGLAQQLFKHGVVGRHLGATGGEAIARAQQQARAVELKFLTQNVAGGVECVVERAAVDHRQRQPVQAVGERVG